LEHIDKFEQANCRVLFVSYTDPDKRLHRLWIEDWCKTYTEGKNAMLLLDPTKSVYQSWAIPSSVAAAFGPRNLWYYTKAICCRGQRKLAIQGEAGQLGADFVLGPGGIIKLRHYCKDPTDRVAVSKIFDAVSSYQNDK